MQMDTLKNQLWAVFRSASTSLRLVDQVKASIFSQQDPEMGALDQYYSMFSETLSVDELQALQNKLLKCAP